MDQRERPYEQSRSWAVILAGGEGERMRSQVCRWLGEHCPKQYCTFVGTRSMLQHTWDRCLGLVDAERIITVIGVGHRRFLQSFPCPEPTGKVIEQPSAKGTLPGVLLPLAHIMAQDPGAVVTVLPSDHYVYPEHRFRKIARAAALVSYCRPDRITVLGAMPDSPEADYGWIEPGASGGLRSRVFGVASFVEKPPRSKAKRLFESGGYWNTMILVSKARFLWECARKLFPEMIARFDELRRLLTASRYASIRPSVLSSAVNAVYEGIVAADLSKHLLQKMPERLLLLPLEGVEWSDWGRPGRIEQSLRRLGKLPHFAAGLRPLAENESPSQNIAPLGRTG